MSGTLRSDCARPDTNAREPAGKQGRMLRESAGTCIELQSRAFLPDRARDQGWLVRFTTQSYCESYRPSARRGTPSDDVA